MRLAVLEISAYRGSEDFEAKCVKHFEALKGHQVDLIVFPELANMPYMPATTDWSPHDYALTLDCKEINLLSAYAAEWNTYIIFPFLEAHDNGMFFNSASLISPSGIAEVIYRKIHLPNGKYANESGRFTIGDLPLRPVKIKEFFVGLAICYDRYFPELFRTLAARGAELILVPSAVSGSALNSWIQLGVSHAVTNRVFYVGINRAGYEIDEKRAFFGQSFATDPWGQILKGFDILDNPRTTIYDMRRDEFDKAKAAWPFLEQWSDLWSVRLKSTS